MAFAEVIGDPVAHSRSPAIHKNWLERLGLAGDYRATRVTPAGLAAYFDSRRGDPDWRGCNVTIPHKQAVFALVDAVEPGAREIGAVNCIHRRGGRLVGANSDVDGVAAALAGADVDGAKAVLIGAGGGARAAVRHLLDRGIGEIRILVRDPVRAESLRHAAPDVIRILPLESCAEAMAGAAILINASPLGMSGAPAMPAALLAAVAAHARGAILFDMVYQPLETAFLAAGRRGGGIPVDGLVMLIGQARAAFTLFFGQAAPPGGDAALRDLLATASMHSSPDRQDAA